MAARHRRPRTEQKGKNDVRIEGRAALDYPAYRKLTWASGRERILRLLVVTLLMGLAALLVNPGAGAVVLVALLVVVALSFELSMRRVWRRLAAGGPAVEIGYELTDEGMGVSLAGVSTHYRWDSLRPLRQTAHHWRLHGLLARRVIAVPKSAFNAHARADVDALFAGSRGSPRVP